MPLTKVFKTFKILLIAITHTIKINLIPNKYLLNYAAQCLVLIYIEHLEIDLLNSVIYMAIFYAKFSYSLHKCARRTTYNNGVERKTQKKIYLSLKRIMI